MEKHAVIDEKHTPKEPNTVQRQQCTGTKTAAQPDLEDSVLKRLTDVARKQPRK